jgi:hypothetical protein
MWISDLMGFSHLNTEKWLSKTTLWKGRRRRRKGRMSPERQPMLL